MKHLSKTMALCSLVAISLGLLTGGCKKSEANNEMPTPPKPGPGEIVKTYDVEGMTCSGCETNVCNTLESLENVKLAKASHQAKKVWIVTAKKDLSDDTVIKAITDADAKYTAKAAKE
ncbi:MAG: heavy-metal-associated domain-containing protein [Phycisphaerales bacterium]|nr:heavy-metal-associated domain-containing protein [Phycisphaerales bacterium]